MYQYYAKKKIKNYLKNACSTDEINYNLELTNNSSEKILNS